MNFTEIPLHILDIFFELHTATVPAKNTVMGNYIIIDAPLETFEITIKTSEKYEHIRISTPNDYNVNDNQILVNYISGDVSNIQNGDDVYFRKNKELYKFIQREEDYKYINTNKDFLYLGKIYSYTTGVYVITINSFYHFIKNALPENNRTTRFTEFLKLAFDRVYPEVYFKQKNIQSLISPKIVKIDYLSYLAGMFGITLDETFVNFNKSLSRIFVENIPNYLKRKGTYSSIYIAANSILSNTANTLNVYERWHDTFDWDVNPNPLTHFVDFNYLNYYSKDTSGNCINNILIDSLNSQGGIPTPINSDVIIHRQTIEKIVWYIHHSLNTKGFILQCYDNRYNRITPSEIYYQSNYIVRLTFSTVKSGYCFMVKPEAQSTLPSTTSVWNFEHNLDTAFPLTEYTNSTHYTISVTDESTEDGDTITVYPPDTNAGIGYAIEADYNYTQNEPTSAWNFDYTDIDNNDSVIVQFLLTEPRKEFEITHNLNTENVLVQCYDQTTKNLTYPISLTIINDDNISLSFTEVFDGFVNICIADSAITQSVASATWEIEHNLDSKLIIAQYFKTNKNQIFEMQTLPVSSGLIETTFSDSIAGYVKIVEADFYEEITDPLSTWEIEHSLDNFCTISQVYAYTTETSASSWDISHELNTKDIIIQCFDSDDYLIEPSSIDILTNNTVNITFSNQKKGYALIKSGADTISFSASASLNIPDDYIFFQVYDSNYSLIEPSTVTQSTDNLNVTLSLANSGYIYYMDSDFTHFQTTAEENWLIAHHLNTNDMMINFYSNNILVEPDSVKIMNSDFIQATFSTATSGFAIVKEANGHYNLMSKISPKEITLIDEDNIEIEFETAVKGHVLVKESDFIGRYVEKGVPETLTLDGNNIQATFNSVSTGYAMIKNVGSVGYHEQLIISPHYKVELDLSCQPYDANAILNENKSNMFVTTLDVVKPVTKYSHYEYKLQPFCDFTNTVRILYGSAYDAECSSYCTNTTFTSASSGSYIYPQYTAATEWIIYHNLNNNVIVQCFDNSDTQIKPKNIQKISDNIVKISWSSAIVGYALVSEIDGIYTQVEMPETVDWTLQDEIQEFLTGNGAVYYLLIDGSNYLLIDDSNYFKIYESLNYAPIIQIYDKKENLIEPDIFVYKESGLKTVDITFNQRTPGYAMLKNNITIIQPTPATVWTINHNSNTSGILTQFYDYDGNLIIPAELVLVDENTLRATFNEDIDGSVLIKTIGNKYTNESITYNINNNGYMKFGNGSNLDNYNAKTANDISSSLSDLNGNEIQTTPIVTDDITKTYITIQGLLDDKIEGPITEVGVFDQFDNLMFYSHFDIIYKQTNTDFNFILKVYRQQL